MSCGQSRISYNYKKDKLMKRTFIYTDEKSSKFWSIETDGDSYTIYFGKTGTKGQSKIKAFDNDEKCQVAADKLISEKLKKGYKESNYEEKYKDIEDSKAGSYYYGKDNAMHRVLHQLQKGINLARIKYRQVRENYNEPVVDILIDEDNYEITFSINEEEFYRYNVDTMEEALVLMQKMDNSGMSASIGQTINNWAEDLNFKGFGECKISDSWSLLEGFEEYEDPDYDEDGEVFNFDSDEDFDDFMEDLRDIGGLEEDDDENEIKIIPLYRIVIMDKKTLKQLILIYDENDVALVVYNAIKGTLESKAYIYESKEVLCDTISTLKKHCLEQNYAWQCEDYSGFNMSRTIEENDIETYSPIDLLTLFMEKRQQPEGQEAIPCKMSVLFKDISNNLVLICDEVGKRILNPSVFPKKYYLTFETEKKTKDAFEKMKDKYIKKGYELTSEKIEEYPFDYSLSVFKRYE